MIRDVQETVKACKSSGVSMTVKSGGHGASGYCLNDGGVVLDLKQFDWILLDRKAERLRVGTGQRFRRVYDYLEASGTGLVPVGGGCPTVGIGGFLLGGGYSFLSRSFGLGADNVFGFKVVTADGRIRSVGQNSKSPADKDLFWALRGGGGGNFGVVVEAELQCRRAASDSLLVGNILFPFHRLPEILKFYSAWAADLPNQMAVYGYLGSQPDPRMPGTQPLMLRLTPIWNGPFGKGVDHLQPLLALAPVSTQLYDMTIHEWEDLISSGTEIRGRSAYIKSVVLNPGEMTPEVTEIFMRYMNRRPSPDSFVVWTQGGGAISNVVPDASAYPHRNAAFIPEVKAIWRSDRPEDMRVNVEWAHDFFDELYEHGSGAYLNYIDPLQREWVKAYHGSNYERLLKIKAAVDPDNFFSFQQGIGSTFDPDLRGRPLNLMPLLRTWSTREGDA
jgi:FAD/FMN-containing dehydrogenase